MNRWTCRPGDTEPGKHKVMLEKNPCLSSDKSVNPRDILPSLSTFPTDTAHLSVAKNLPGPSKLYF